MRREGSDGIKASQKKEDHEKGPRNRQNLSAGREPVSVVSRRLLCSGRRGKDQGNDLRKKTVLVSDRAAASRGLVGVPTTGDRKEHGPNGAGEHPNAAGLLHGPR